MKKLLTSALKYANIYSQVKTRAKSSERGNKMKFTKYNNPNKRRAPKRRTPHSKEYINERRAELIEALAKTDDPSEQEMLIKTYSISINP